ncbi:ATP-binding protein [Kineococcus gynurae]|uniref:histidine kinase n=1 Tax=Kineococcus gynurae TaxID=452979 RepID=A0ABV5LXS0_9ACTN
MSTAPGRSPQGGSDGPARRGVDPRGWPFTRQALAVQVLLVLAVLVVCLSGTAFVVQRQVSDEVRQRALAIARTVAEDDAVRAGAERASDAPPPADAAERATLVDGAVQAAAEDVRRRTGALFVVVTDDRGLRLAHPTPDRLGLRVSTDPTVALAGGEEVEDETGTLGGSARAKVPVWAPGQQGPDGRVVGEVSVGVADDAVARRAARAVLPAAGVALVALLVGSLAAVALSRRLRRLTMGLQPEEIRGLLQGHEAVLHGIAEGVVALGPDDRVVLANDEAARLLDRDLSPGTPTEDWPPAVRSVVRDPGGLPALALVGERALLIGSRGVRREGRDLGVVLTLNDRTDVELLTRQLDAVQEVGTVLRAQRHEFSNRLHLLSGLLAAGETGEASSYVGALLGTGPLGSQVEGLEAVADPYLQAFVSAKAAHARERGVHLRLGEVALRGRVVDPVDVTTVLGNLVDNAVTAVTGRVPAVGAGPADPGAVVEMDLVQDGTTLVVAVTDSGDGVAESLRENVFEAGVTTRPSGVGGIGLGLVRQVARARGGQARLADPGGGREGPGLGGAVFVVTLPGVLSPTAPSVGEDPGDLEDPEDRDNPGPDGWPGADDGWDEGHEGGRDR